MFADDVVFAKMAPKPAETTNYFTCEAMMFIAAALFFNTLTAPVVKLTQNEQGGYDYNKFCVYFFAEFFKLAAAVVWCYRAWAANDPAVVKHLVFEKTDFMQYAVPGFVFFAQNNLSFLALQHMNSSAFQLLMNTRIVSVAVLAVLVLNKKLHALEWTSITLLMVGAMQYQLSGCGGDGYKIDGQGLVVMAVIVACAAGGNVYTQKVMQKKMDQPLMVQNAMLYVWGVIFNLVNWMLSVVPSAEQHGAPTPLFGAVGGIQIFSMVFYAIYGLSISVILKRFGAITRTFINTAAICFTALIDVAFFGASISVLELTTFGVIMLAVYLHTVLSKNYIPPPPPPGDGSPAADAKV